MTAFQILQDRAGDTGWDFHSMLTLACSFIDEQGPGLQNRFDNFVQQQRDLECEANATRYAEVEKEEPDFNTEWVPEDEEPEDF